MKRSVLGAVAVLFLLTGMSHAADGPKGKFSIKAERNKYRVGEVMKLTIAFDNMKNPFKGGAYDSSFVSLPEITSEDGLPVKKIPLYRPKTWVMPSSGGNDNPFEKGGGEITVGWRIERKVWRDEATGEVIYDGVGIEAGATPMGAYLYMLEKVPCKYAIALNWLINAEIDRSDYNVDLNKTDSRISNTISIEVMPEK